MQRLQLPRSPIRGLTTRFLDDLVEEGECDLIARFAALLPSDVISTLLGAPPEDHNQLRIWTADLLTREDGVAEPPEFAQQASQNLIVYFQRLIQEKRKSVSEDLISALVEAEVDGRRLSDEEILGFAMLLIAGGNETT